MSWLVRHGGSQKAAHLRAGDGSCRAGRRLRALHHVLLVRGRAEDAPHAASERGADAQLACAAAVQPGLPARHGEAFSPWVAIHHVICQRSVAAACLHSPMRARLTFFLSDRRPTRCSDRVLRGEAAVPAGAADGPLRRELRPWPVQRHLRHLQPRRRPHVPRCSPGPASLGTHLRWYEIDDVCSSSKADESDVASSCNPRWSSVAGKARTVWQLRDNNCCLAIHSRLCAVYLWCRGGCIGSSEAGATASLAHRGTRDGGLRRRRVSRLQERGHQPCRS